MNIGFIIGLLIVACVGYIIGYLRGVHKTTDLTVKILSTVRDNLDDDGRALLDKAIGKTLNKE